MRDLLKYSLDTLDAIQKQLIKLIADSVLTISLDRLTYRRSDFALSLFYRYHGLCSSEIKSIIPSQDSIYEIRVSLLLQMLLEICL